MGPKHQEDRIITKRGLMKISIVTPTIRPELMGMVANCLKKQDFTDFEWLIGTRPEMVDDIKAAIGDDDRFKVLPEPPKKDGDYYNLAKCWNMLFKEVQGELVLSIVDGIWFSNDTLTNFWKHFEDNPKACVGGIGHQYEGVEMGKPQILVWKDPRARLDQGSFYEIYPIDLELCMTSLPTQAIKNVGGVDEDYDRVAALSEKDMCLRMEKLGYKFYLDQSLEYRALKHPRLNNDWENKYQEGCVMFQEKIHNLNEGIRSPRLDFLD